MVNRLRITHMLACFLGLIICTCLMSSCEKDSTKTSYMISFGWTDLSQPRDIPDAVIRDKYEQIISDIYSLKPTTDAIWDVWVVNSKYKDEDRKAEEKFNSHLNDVKQIEAKCKKIIDDLDIRDGISFFVTVEYVLKRWDLDEDIELQNYSFELKYN